MIFLLFFANRKKKRRKEEVRKRNKKRRGALFSVDFLKRKKILTVVLQHPRRRHQLRSVADGRGEPRRDDLESLVGLEGGFGRGRFCCCVGSSGDLFAAFVGGGGGGRGHVRRRLRLPLLLLLLFSLAVVAIVPLRLLMLMLVLLLSR